MAQKIIEIQDIGQVILSKRKGAKNLRLSIMPTGVVRVSLPAWAPYSAGIRFALGRAEWIRQNSGNSRLAVLKNGQRIGKSYRLQYISSPNSKTTQSRLGINSITVSSPYNINHIDVQTRARKAAERALKKEAQILLGSRLKQIAAKNGYEYSKLQIRRLTSRWGSCSIHGVITLNFFLIQLPWRLIDYVIVHELAHTQHLNHSREFWEAVEAILPDAKQRRKEIKQYRPVLSPAD
jgi:predicted metal-dependent hydrolase